MFGVLRFILFGNVELREDAENAVTAFDGGVEFEVEARRVFQDDVLAHARLNLFAVLVEEANHFDPRVFVAENRDVHPGVAQIGRGIDAGDGDGAGVEVAVDEQTDDVGCDFTLQQFVDPDDAPTGNNRIMKDEL